MPRSWSIASRNQVTQPHRPPTSGDTTRFRSSDKAIDLKKLLEVYDDYPVVLHSLERTSAALARAEDDARVADEHKEQTDADLKYEKEEREKDRKQAERDQKDAVKKRDEKVRAELNPKIKELEEKLKAMTTDRDTQRKDLGDLRRQMGGWITSMDKLHKERVAGEEKEVKAAEERAKLATKLKTLDDEILQGLKAASEKAELQRPVPSRTESRETVTSVATSRAPTTRDRLDRQDSRQTTQTFGGSRSTATSSRAPTTRDSYDRSDSRSTIAPTMSRTTSIATTVKKRGDGLER